MKLCQRKQGLRDPSLLLAENGSLPHRLLGRARAALSSVPSGTGALGMNRARVMPAKQTDTVSEIIAEYGRKRAKEESKLKVVKS